MLGRAQKSPGLLPNPAPAPQQPGETKTVEMPGLKDQLNPLQRFQAYNPHGDASDDIAGASIQQRVDNTAQRVKVMDQHTVVSLPQGKVLASTDPAATKAHLHRYNENYGAGQTAQKQNPTAQYGGLAAGGGAPPREMTPEELGARAANWNSDVRGAALLDQQKASTTSTGGTEAVQKPRYGLTRDAVQSGYYRAAQGAKKAAQPAGQQVVGRVSVGTGGAVNSSAGGLGLPPSSGAFPAGRTSSDTLFGDNFGSASGQRKSGVLVKDGKARKSRATGASQNVAFAENGGGKKLLSHETSNAPGLYDKMMGTKKTRTQSEVESSKMLAFPSLKHSVTAAMQMQAANPPPTWTDADAAERNRKVAEEVAKTNTQSPGSSVQAMLNQGRGTGASTSGGGGRPSGAEARSQEEIVLTAQQEAAGAGGNHKGAHFPTEEEYAEQRDEVAAAVRARLYAQTDAPFSASMQRGGAPVRGRAGEGSASYGDDADELGQGAARAGSRKSVVKKGGVTLASEYANDKGPAPVDLDTIPDMPGDHGDTEFDKKYGHRKRKSAASLEHDAGAPNQYDFTAPVRSPSSFLPTGEDTKTPEQQGLVEPRYGIEGNVLNRAHVEMVEEFLGRVPSYFKVKQNVVYTNVQKLAAARYAQRANLSRAENDFLDQLEDLNATLDGMKAELEAEKKAVLDSHAKQMGGIDREGKAMRDQLDMIHRVNELTMGDAAARNSVLETMLRKKAAERVEREKVMEVVNKQLAAETGAAPARPYKDAYNRDTAEIGAVEKKAVKNNKPSVEVVVGAGGGEKDKASAPASSKEKDRRKSRKQEIIEKTGKSRLSSIGDSTTRPSSLLDGQLVAVPASAEAPAGADEEEDGLASLLKSKAGKKGLKPKAEGEAYYQAGQFDHGRDGDWGGEYSNWQGDQDANWEDEDEGWGKYDWDRSKEQACSQHHGPAGQRPGAGSGHAQYAHKEPLWVGKNNVNQYGGAAVGYNARMQGQRFSEDEMNHSYYTQGKGKAWGADGLHPAVAAAQRRYNRGADIDLSVKTTNHTSNLESDQKEKFGPRGRR
eukprot:g1441.t1